MGPLIRQLSSLDATEAPIGGVVPVTPHPDGPTVLDVDEDSAAGVAEATKRSLAGGHGIISPGPGEGRMTALQILGDPALSAPRAIHRHIAMIASHSNREDP
jgi:hypothetical protein